MAKPPDETAVSRHPVPKQMRTPKGSEVPPSVLDRAVKPVKATRPYVFESFTQADWDAVRERLPLVYRWLSNEQLTRQACNRRKQGAYTSKAKKKQAALWAEVKKAVRAYWTGDASLEELGDALKKLAPATTAVYDSDSGDTRRPPTRQAARRPR